MQVIVQGLIMKVDKLWHTDYPLIIGINRNGDKVHRGMHISEIKTLVIEYETELNNLVINQIPLKWKQWQAAINNSEVDSDKIVQFDTINFGMGECDQCGAQQFTSYRICNYNGICKGTIIPLKEYAKIIPQRVINFQEKYKNVGKRPTEEQQLEKLADLLTSHDVRKHLNINGFGYSQVERDIVKLFNNMLK
jgi:hypothetical protein